MQRQEQALGNAGGKGGLSQAWKSHTQKQIQFAAPRQPAQADFSDTSLWAASFSTDSGITTETVVTPYSDVWVLWESHIL